MTVISLAAGCVLDATPPETVDAAAAAGFDAAGVWHDLGTWSDGVARSVRRRLDDTGLIALDIEVGRLRPEGNLDELFRLVDAGVDVGAKHVLCVSLDDDLSRTASRFATVCDRARGTDMRVVLEFMRFTSVRTLPEAVAVVREAGHPAGGVLIDSLHLSRGGNTPADVVAFAAAEPSLFPYLQLCDAVAEIPPFEDLVDEALNTRLLPGEGALPLADLLNAVAPATPLSVELRSKVLRTTYGDPVERARVIARATRACLAEVASGQGSRSSDRIAT